MKHKEGIILLVSLLIFGLVLSDYRSRKRNLTINSIIINFNEANPSKRSFDIKVLRYEFGLLDNDQLSNILECSRGYKNKTVSSSELVKCLNDNGFNSSDKQSKLLSVLFSD